LVIGINKQNGRKWKKFKVGIYKQHEFGEE
jgi:hypothetical protein